MHLFRNLTGRTRQQTARTRRATPDIGPVRQELNLYLMCQIKVGGRLGRPLFVFNRYLPCVKQQTIPNLCIYWLCVCQKMILRKYECKALMIFKCQSLKSKCVICTSIYGTLNNSYS